MLDLNEGQIKDSSQERPCDLSTVMLLPGQYRWGMGGGYKYSYSTKLDLRRERKWSWDKVN